MASHVLLFQTPWTVATRLLCPWDSPGKNWSRLPFPSPRIFPTQGSNPHLLHRQGDSLPSSHLGKPGIFFIMYILPQVKKKTAFDFFLLLEIDKNARPIDTCQCQKFRGPHGGQLLCLGKPLPLEKIMVCECEEKEYFNSESQGKHHDRDLNDKKNFHSEVWRDYSRLFKCRDKTLALLPWE